MTAIITAPPDWSWITRRGRGGTAPLAADTPYGPQTSRRSIRERMRPACLRGGSRPPAPGRSVLKAASRDIHLHSFLRRRPSGPSAAVLFVFPEILDVRSLLVLVAHECHSMKRR